MLPCKNPTQKLMWYFLGKQELIIETAFQSLKNMEIISWFNHGLTTVISQTWCSAGTDMVSNHCMVNYILLNYSKYGTKEGSSLVAFIKLCINR